MTINSVFQLKASHGEAVNQFMRYFEIQPKKPDFAFLSELIYYYSKIPYENLSKIIQYRRFFDDGGAIRLPADVMEGYARHKLGGTCFALTFFLQCILTRQGFQVYPVMADMKWGDNVHCAVVVLLQGKAHLVDPGYLLNHPMELTADKPRFYKTEFSGVEIAVKEEGVYELFTFDKTQFKWRYRFRNQPVSLDVFLSHWIASFRWNAMHGLCLTRVEKDRMVYIHKHFMRETGFQGKKNANIRNSYHQTIESVFGIGGDIVEEALAAIESNMRLEQQRGLWMPKKTWKPMT